MSFTRPESGEDEPDVQRIHQAVTVLIGGNTTGLVNAHCAGETGQYEARIERVHLCITIGISVTHAAARAEQNRHVVTKPIADPEIRRTVAVLRFVESTDFMTADWVRVDYELLGRISTRVMNEVAGINRVVCDISSKPPATIEWE